MCVSAEIKISSVCRADELVCVVKTYETTCCLIYIQLNKRLILKFVINHKNGHIIQKIYFVDLIFRLLKGITVIKNYF